MPDTHYTVDVTVTALCFLGMALETVVSPRGFGVFRLYNQQLHNARRETHHHLVMAHNGKKPLTGELYSHKLEQRAFRALRQGYETNALYLFREVVARNPGNVRAWRALIDLESEVDARVVAAEHVLTLEPFDDEVRARVDTLRHEQERVYRQKKGWAQEQVERAQEYEQNGQMEEARALLEGVVAVFQDDARAWRMLAKLRQDDLDGLIEALEQVVRCDPDDSRSRAALARWRYLREHPLKLAAWYEEQGNLERALEIWRQQTLYARTPREWRMIYHNVQRLDRLMRTGKSRHFPLLAVSWLTFVPLILYFMLLGLQTHLNFAEATPAAWLAGAGVFLGGLLLAVLYVDDVAPEGLWRASTLARWLVGALGWGILLISFGFLLF